MKDCIFCKIISKEIKSEIVYEDDKIMVIKDINPQAPIHNLVIPRRHFSTLNDCSEKDKEIIGELILKAKEIAEKEPKLASGYRLVLNNGKEAGQAVFHIHLHLLGGRRMTWPPG